MLGIDTLKAWLWDAACAIRGPVDAPKFKDYILPLAFLKHLSDVFDDEMARLAEEYGSLLGPLPQVNREVARAIVEGERGTIAQGRGLVRFYIPDNARWEQIRAHGQVGLGQYLTDVVRAQEEALPLEKAEVLRREAEEERAEDDRALNDFKTLLHDLMTVRRRLPGEFIARFAEAPRHE